MCGRMKPESITILDDDPPGAKVRLIAVDILSRSEDPRLKALQPALKKLMCALENQAIFYTYHRTIKRNARS